MTTSMKVNFFKSIKFKAWLGIFILAILPLICFGLYSFDALGNMYRDILIDSCIQAFKQVKYEVDQYVTKFDELTKFMASDERLKKTDEEVVTALRHMDQSYEGIERIILVDSKGNLKAHSKREASAINRMTTSESILAKSKQSFMFAPEAFIIKVKLSDEADSDCIITTVSFMQLRKSLEGITFGTNFRYFLVTESGENILEQPDFPKNVIADLMSQPCGAYDLFPADGNVSADASPQIAVSLPILHYNLRIFVFQNASEVYEAARKLGDNTISFILLLGLASFVLATYLSWSLTEPVSTIAEKATELSEGKSDVSVNIDRDDEIGFLAKSFNFMSKKITRKITEISSLYQVTHFIASCKTSREALDLCLSHIVEIFKAKRGSIMLINEQHTALTVESFKLALGDSDLNENNETDEEKHGEHKSKFVLKIGEGVAGQVAASGEPILCMDCSKDERFKNYSSDSSKSSISPSTLISVPLSAKGKILGVVNLSDRSNSQPFTDEDLALLLAIANQMALSIDNARLRELTVVNEQTSLYVRRYLDIRLDDEIKRSKRFSIPLSVVLFSIDGIEELNTEYGSVAYDAVLYEIGRLLKKTVRATDIPAEFDSSIFCAILAHTSEEQAKMFADRFRGLVEAYNIIRDEVSFKVTLSAGLCQYSFENNDDYSVLLEKCVKALEESQKQGNSTSIYASNAKGEKK